MIKNIVFDLGRVLVEFDPLTYIKGFGFDDAVSERLFAAVFGRDWYLHDRGDYETITDLRDALERKYPDLALEIRTVLTGDWVKIHYLKTDTEAYLRELKSRGYPIYILSNLSVESYEFIKEYDFFSLISGGVFSYQEHACKPEDAIYRALLDRYGLASEETVFLDDNPDNIAAANAIGIHGVLFTDLPAARAETERLLRGDLPC